MRALLIVALFGASALAANLVSCTRNGIVSPGDRFPWWPAEENVSHQCVTFFKNIFKIKII